MKEFILGALAAIFVLALGAFVYLGLGFAPIGADAEHPAWEAAIMSSAMHASVRRRAPKIHNPLCATDKTLIAGGKLYWNDCAGCHGTPERPINKYSSTFYPQPRQFPLLATRYSEAEVFWVSKHGIRRTGMFPQGSDYTDTELWSLSAFISRMDRLPAGILQVIQKQSQ